MYLKKWKHYNKQQKKKIKYTQKTTTYENTHRMNLYQDRDVNDVRCRGKWTQDSPILCPPPERHVRDHGFQQDRVASWDVNCWGLESPRGGEARRGGRWLYLGASWDPRARPRESALTMSALRQLQGPLRLRPREVDQQGGLVLLLWNLFSVLDAFVCLPRFPHRWNWWTTRWGKIQTVQVIYFVPSTSPTPSQTYDFCDYWG